MACPRNEGSGHPPSPHYHGSLLSSIWTLVYTNRGALLTYCIIIWAAPTALCPFPAASHPIAHRKRERNSKELKTQSQPGAETRKLHQSFKRGWPHCHWEGADWMQFNGSITRKVSHNGV